HQEDEAEHGAPARPERRADARDCPRRLPDLGRLQAGSFSLAPRSGSLGHHTAPTWSPGQRVWTVAAPSVSDRRGLQGTRSAGRRSRFVPGACRYASTCADTPLNVELPPRASSLAPRSTPLA